MKRFLVALVVGLLAVGVLVTNSDVVVSAHRHSCGYKCSPDGGGSTESEPPKPPEVRLAGRVNQHSGGREGGAANKRVGHPGGPSHPNVFVGPAGSFQLLAVDGFGRNRGTRPHHPRDSCRCVHGSH